jgi:hypothetical protein
MAVKIRRRLSILIEKIIHSQANELLIHDIFCVKCNQLKMNILTDLLVNNNRPTYTYTCLHIRTRINIYMAKKKKTFSMSDEKQKYLAVDKK